MTDFLPISRRRLLTSAGAGLAMGPLVTPIGRALADSVTPKRGGTLTVVQTLLPTSLLTLTTSAGSDYAISAKITEGLLAYDFGFKPRPQLATAWVIAEDGKTITFTLRQGVKWHDGQDFTSADVAFSILLLKQVHPRGRLTFANVTDVETPDAFTARLILKAPAPYLISALAAEESPIVPKHLYEGTDAATNPHNKAPVGTGPFVFKEYVVGSHVIFERNPNYWEAPKPYIDRIVFRLVSDLQASATLLETGEADIGGSEPVSLADVERLKGIPRLGVETRGFDYLQTISRIEFDLEHPAFKHLEVRQAVAHAIDKRVIQNTAFYGFGEIATGPIPKAHGALYTPDVPQYPFDLKKAESLLDAAGFPRGTDGVRFKVTLDPLPTEVLRKTAEYVRQALGKVGISVTLRLQDFPTYIKRIYADREFDFMVNNMNTSTDPTLGVQRLYWSKNIKKGVPFSNAAHYRNDDVDRDLEAAASEIDPQKRAELFWDFQRRVVADLPAIDLIVPQQLTIYDKRVINHTIGADGINANWADLWLDR